jgi:hypothetical protein
MTTGAKESLPSGMGREKREIAIYQDAKGRPAMDVRLEQETVWLTQKQMASLFDTERSVITKHLRNILKEEELQEAAVCAKFAHTAADGKTYKTSYCKGRQT